MGPFPATIQGHIATLHSFLQWVHNYSGDLPHTDDELIREYVQYVLNKWEEDARSTKPANDT